MAANLTEFGPPDTVVYSIGIVAEHAPQSGTTDQGYKVPNREKFARQLNHFGKADRAQLILADSRSFDFGRLAPFDFVFVDGRHDYPSPRLP